MTSLLSPTLFFALHKHRPETRTGPTRWPTLPTAASSRTSWHATCLASPSSRPRPRRSPRCSSPSASYATSNCSSPEAFPPSKVRSSHMESGCRRFFCRGNFCARYLEGSWFAPRWRLIQWWGNLKAPFRHPAIASSGCRGPGDGSIHELLAPLDEKTRNRKLINWRLLQAS